MLEKTGRKVVPKPKIPVPGEEEDGLEGQDVPKKVETLIMDKTAGFDHVVVWDHEAVPGAEDMYVKGVEEWIGFAEAVSLRRRCMHCCGFSILTGASQMHSYDVPQNQGPS